MDELKLRRGNSAVDWTVLRTAIENLDEEITKLGGRKEKLLDLYLNQVAGEENLKREEYAKRSKQLSSELKQAETKRAELLDRTQDDVVDIEQTNLSQLLEAKRAASSNANIEERRVVLRLLNAQVLYDGLTLQLVGAIPL